MKSHAPLPASITLDLERFDVQLDFAQAQLRVTVLDSANAGFSDTVDCDVKPLLGGLVALSRQEHIGTTVVHVVDLETKTTTSFETPKRGDFKRLSGKIMRSRPKAAHSQIQTQEQPRILASDST